MGTIRSGGAWILDRRCLKNFGRRSTAVENRFLITTGTGKPERTVWAARRLTTLSKVRIENERAVGGRHVAWHGVRTSPAPKCRRRSERGVDGDLVGGDFRCNGEGRPMAETASSNRTGFGRREIIVLVNPVLGREERSRSNGVERTLASIRPCRWREIPVTVQKIGFNAIGVVSDQ